MSHNNEIKKINNEQAGRIIDIRYPLGLFYVLKAGVYIGIDNSNGEAWTEEFPNLRKCKRWLSNPNIETEDDYVYQARACEAVG